MYQVHLTMREISKLTSVVIDTDCIGSCKSNYHMITTTTASIWRQRTILIMINEVILYIFLDLVYWWNVLIYHLCILLKIHVILYNEACLGRSLFLTTKCRLARQVDSSSQSWFDVRDGCLFCWYWWNCWPSLFKPSLGEMWVLAMLILVELLTITV